MKFLLRNGIFILFPAVMVAIIFLAAYSFGAAVRFGEWGERSVAESTLIVAQEKVDRIEEVIRVSDNLYFQMIDPETPDNSCMRWHNTAPSAPLVEAAVILDDNGIPVAFFHRTESGQESAKLFEQFKTEIIPLVDRYESVDQYKHVHFLIGGEYRLITHLTTLYQGKDFTVCILYDTSVVTRQLLPEVLGNIGSDRMANVVDDQNVVIYGRSIDDRLPFVVSKRFPSTLYKWQLQLAPTSEALFSSHTKAKARYFSEVMLLPLALGVIVLGLVVLYLSVVRERRVSRLKSDFIANVSHELKTPLSLIRMASEILLLGKVTKTEKVERYYEIIVRETERLGSLIDNVLDLARSERVKTAYLFEPRNLTDIATHSTAVFQPRAISEGVNLELFLEPDLPPLSVDEHAIHIAMINLLDNALKYGQGTKKIRLEIRRILDVIHIDVIDTGVGIPPGQIKRVFERFYRIPCDQTRQQRGSGIGLSLVKHIAEAHGGKVVVTSVPTVMTRFSIQIPLR